MKPLFILLLLCPYLLMAQQPKPPTIGNKIPLVAFTLSNGDTIRLAAKPLTLLAFFDTRCTACFTSLRNAKNLQSAMAPVINIIPVSGQPLHEVNGFFSQHATITLPFIAGDTLLSGFFQHATVPHWVWLSANGTVKAITSGSYVTKENITAMASGNNLVLPVKNDVLDYVREKPLLVNDNGGNQDAYICRSLFTRYLNGVPGGLGWQPDKIHNTTRVIATNATLLSLYALAYNESLINRNQVLLDGIDPAKGSYHPAFGPRQQWEQQNLYCYELQFPSAIRSQVQRVVLQDLDRFFNTTSTYERKTVKCFLLKKLSPTPFTGSGEDEFAEVYPDSIVLKKQPAYTLVKQMNRIPAMPPVLDATNDKGTLNMILHCNITDIPALQKELQRYGLHLEESVRTIPFITITAKNF